MEENLCIDLIRVLKSGVELNQLSTQLLPVLLYERLLDSSGKALTNWCTIFCIVKKISDKNFLLLIQWPQVLDNQLSLHSVTVSFLL